MPRLTSTPAGEALDMVGVSLTDDTGNLKSALQIYKEVSVEYQKLDNMNKSIVAEGLAGKYHISRMTALLDNMDLVEKMYSDSQNSANSARIENDKYMQSLQARINLAKVEFEQLAVAVGEAFLTEGFIQFLKMMSNMAAGATSLTKVIGVLPILLGTLGAAVMLLSTRMRTLGVALVFGTTEVRRQQLALIGLSTGMTRAAVATTVFKTALKGLLVASGIGVAFALLGGAIELVMKKMGQARQETEEYDRRSHELMMSFKDNKDSVMQLSAEYAELDSKMKNGAFDDTDLKRYTEVSNELAGLMPSLVVGEDQYGNKILASSTFIQAKTAHLQKQLEVQEKLDAKEAKKAAEKDYNAASTKLDDVTGKRDSAITNLNQNLAGLSGGTGLGVTSDKDIFIKSINDVIAKIDELEAKKKEASLTELEGMQLTALKGAYDELDKYSIKIEDAKLAMSSASAKMIEQMAKADDSLSASTKSMIMDISMLVATSESGAGTIDKVLGNMGDKLENDSKFKGTLESYGDAVDEYESKVESGLTGENLETYADKAEKAYLKVRDAIIAMAKAEGMNPDELARLAGQLDASAVASLNLDNSMDVLAGSTGMTTDELQAQLNMTPDLAGSLDDVGDSAVNASGGMDTLSSSANNTNSTLSTLIAGYQSLSEEVAPLNGLLEDLAAGKKLTATEALDLIAAEEGLANAITFENGMVKVNIKAVEALRDTKTNAFDKMVEQKRNEVAIQAETTRSKLKNYGIEIKAIQSLADAQSALAQMEKQRIDDLSGQHSMASLTAIDQQYTDVRTELQAIENAYATFDSLESMIGNSLKIVGTSKETFDSDSKAKEKNTKSTKDNTKAQEENYEAYKKNIYVADEYKFKLEEINQALAKQNTYKAKYATYSEKYRKAIREEIALLERQKKLTLQQADSLSKQIRSGKIKEYGVIDVSSSVLNTETPSSGSKGGGSSKAPAGAYKGKYHAIINKAANTYGVDPFLIASMIKQESNFNPKAVSSAGAKGLMQLMPGTARGLGVKNSFDPTQNIMGGTKYIAQMLAKTGGDVKKALIAYNAGLGNLNKVLNSGAGSWKEPKNYVNKILGYYQGFTGGSYGKASTSSSYSKAAVPPREKASSNASIVKSVVDYYFRSFRVSDHFGSKRGSGSHKGTDFANGKAGSAIKAINSGKVTVAGYSKTAGNWVVIQQDDGKVAKYMHMLKKPNVKRGQRVGAGAILGQVGNTGDSNGNHLHLQVEAGGKPIDAVKYLKTLQSTINNGVSSGGGISYSSDFSTPEMTVAEQLSRIDQAKSELLQLKTDVSELDAQLLELKDQIVQSLVDEFEYKKNIQRVNAENMKNQMYGKSTVTTDYRKNLNKQREYVIEQQRINEVEIKKIKELLKLKSITAGKRSELESTLNDLMSQRYDLAAERDALAMEKVNSRMEEYARQIDNVDVKLAYNASVRQQYSDDSVAYGKSIALETKLLEEKRQLIKRQINELTWSLKVEKLTFEQRAELIEQLEDYKQSVYDLNNEIANGKIAQIEFKFRVDDKVLNETSSKISFIEYKMSLLDKDASGEIKTGLFKEMNDELVNANAELETAIQRTVKLRTEAGISGLNTDVIDERIKSLIEQRRSNVQSLTQNYQEMVSATEEAKSKMEEAENEANEKAQKDFDKMLKDSEKRINSFQKVIAKAADSMELLESDQFRRKQELLGDSLLATRNRAAQIITEFNYLRNTTAYTEEQADTLRSRLEQLKEELVASNKSTIEYVKTLEQVTFDSLTRNAKLADAEISRLTGNLRSTMELLDGGMLSGSEIDFKFNIPQGSSLDLASFINDPISDIETDEIRIQEIKKSSYGEQLREAEKFHGEMEYEAKKYKLNILEAEKQFQEAMQKLLTESDDKIKSRKGKTLEDVVNGMKEEKELLKTHISDIESAMSLGLSSYTQEYASQWDSVLKVLDKKLKEAKSKMDSLNKYIKDNSTHSYTVPTGTSSSTSFYVDSKGQLIDKATGKVIKKYATGTGKSGHQGGLAVISEEGRELIQYPNGNMALSGDNGAELANLPRGTHVIPNAQTEALLKSFGIPAYANGTWDYDRMKVDDDYWMLYLQATDPKSYNKVLDSQNGYNTNDYYRDSEGYLIDKRNGSWVKPSYEIPHYDKNYAPDEIDIPYTPPTYYENDFTPYYPEYTPPTTHVPTADELAQIKLDGLRSTKANVYSDEFISKYDPYHKRGSRYQRERESESITLKGLQQQLDALEKYGTHGVKELTEQILNKQNEMASQDMNFLAESLKDLATQREKNARTLREELIYELEHTDMTEDMRNQYREEIMQQDDIIAQSQKDRRSLIAETFTYEQKLRDRRLHMITENERDIQRAIAETRLNNPDDPKLIELNNKLLEQQAKYSGEIAKNRQSIIDQMKKYEVGSYEWNLLNNQLLQNEIGYQRERLSQLDEENSKEERNISLQEKKDELDKVRKDKRFSYIQSDGTEILTYDKGKVEDLEKEIADLEKQYRKDDIKEEYAKELSLLEGRLSQGIQLSPEELAESQSHLDSLVEMYKKLNEKDKEEANKNLLKTATFASNQKSVQKLFEFMPNGQLANSLQDEINLPVNDMPNLFADIAKLVSSIKAGNQQETVVQHHYDFSNVTVKANNMDEFLGSLEHITRTK